MRLHLITDRRRLAGGDATWKAQRACLLQQVRFAADAGIDIVQVREHDLEAGRLFDLVLAGLAAVAGTRTRLVVNDRLDVALAAGAHGVHLRGTSIPPSVARQLAPAGFLIGRSVHSIAETAAVAPAVDYLVAGTVWPTPSKPAEHPLLGPDRLSQVVQAAAGVPVFAIGGVTLARLPLVREAGAAGVAAIGLYIRGGGSADTRGECGAVPLHDLAREAAIRFGQAASPTS